MDSEVQNKNKIDQSPDFGKIFKEMAQKKDFPELMQYRINNRKEWSFLDVIKMNEELFDNPTTENLEFNQQHRAYDKKSIKKILDYQKEHNLNNSEIARMFKCSRNTLSKWQRMFDKKTL